MVIAEIRKNLFMPWDSSYVPFIGQSGVFEDANAEISG